MAKNKPLDKKVTFSHLKGEISVSQNSIHSFYEIHLFLEGNTEFVCGTLRKNLSPFDIVLIPAGEYQRFITHGDASAFERCILTVPATLLGEELLKEAFGRKRILRLGRNHPIVKHMLHLKEACETMSEEDFSLILPDIATELIFLIKQAENTYSFEENGLQRLSVAIMDYINANHKGALSLSKIADAFFVSVSTICHYFKEDFGISIKQYIIEKKMSEAKILIEKGHKAQDVCALLGFENYSSFFRAYRKYFGCSPSGRK